MMMKAAPTISLTLFFLGFWWIATEAKVVVFFPVPAASHIRYHTNIARAVSQLGHEAWICMAESVAANRVDTSGLGVITYGHTIGDIEEKIIVQTRLHEMFWNNETTSFSHMFTVFSMFDEVATLILKEGIVNKVNAVKPDLFVLDGVPFVRRIAVVPYKLGVPYALIGTAHDVVGYRIPFHPGATPLQMVDFNDQMSFPEKLTNTFLHAAMTIQSAFQEDVSAIYAPEKPHKTVNQIIAGAEIFIAELDPVMDYPRPMLPNVKLIGGTAVKDVRPLKGPFKEFMDKSKNGVIIISFGTTVLNVPTFVFEKLHSVVKQSGLNAVWRSDQPSPDPNRFLMNSWIPQNDLLGHPNAKLFISHCGKNGQYEALYNGVPILCLPIFGDQMYNAERVRAKMYGLKADIRFVTREDLFQSVDELISNPVYKETISKASKLFRLLYKSPMKEAAFWIDHVMEFGGGYMRSSTQTMHLFQFLMLDLIAVVLVAFAMLVFIVYALVQLICRCKRKAKSVKSKSA